MHAASTPNALVAGSRPTVVASWRRSAWCRVSESFGGSLWIVDLTYIYMHACWCWEGSQNLTISTQICAGSSILAETLKRAS
eukprot:scaffold168866_cov25-Tisochrysis_lutea.AAC.1